MEPEARRDADLSAIVAQLREEMLQLRREVLGLRCEVGYWKSRHADALKRNEKLERELKQARAEIKNLKADLFGSKSEKQTSGDRSNSLEDPQDRNAKKKKRGQQPNRSGPKRRDYSHLRIFPSVRKRLSCRRSNASASVAASRCPNIPKPKTRNN